MFSDKVSIVYINAIADEDFDLGYKGFKNASLFHTCDTQSQRAARIQLKK